jgi:Protein of unknown function (DUF1573)
MINRTTDRFHRLMVGAGLIVLLASSQGCGTDRASNSIGAADAAPSRSVACSLVTIPETLYLGAVAVGSESAFRFVVQNNGPVAATIDRVQPSCGCTKIAPSVFTLPPGESMEVTGVFTVGDAAGRMRKSIALVSKEQRTEVQIEAEAIRQLTFAPTAPVLTPDFLLDLDGACDVTLRNDSSDTVSLQLVEDARSGVSVTPTAIPHIAPGEAVDLVVS